MTIVKVYGSKNCGRCISVKNALKNGNIDHEYHNLEDISPVLKDTLTKKAREKGMLQLPIIIKEEEPTTLQEVLKNESRN